MWVKRRERDSDANEKPTTKAVTPDAPTRRRIKQRTRAQRRELKDKNEENGVEVKECKKNKRGIGRDVGNGGDLDEKIKKGRRESYGSVDVNLENLENRQEIGREAQGAQGLSKNGRGSVYPLSHMINYFCNKHH